MWEDGESGMEERGRRKRNEEKEKKGNKGSIKDARLPFLVTTYRVTRGGGLTHCDVVVWRKVKKAK